MDWVRLGSSNYDLAGTKGVIRPISYEELAKHNKVDDIWLAIRGKVYNVTKYMEFHPGGMYITITIIFHTKKKKNTNNTKIKTHCCCHIGKAHENLTFVRFAFHFKKKIKRERKYTA